MKWTKEEIDLVKECIESGSTHREIADFIYEDFGIIRTAGSVKVKCYDLGIKSKNNARKNTEQYKLEVPNNIKVIDEYVNAHIKIEHECLDCGYKWKSKPNDILRGHGCPDCANKAKPGYYANLTKEQADGLGYPLYLYNVKLQYEDEVFFKFGLTKNEDRSRFKQYKPYKVIEELSFVEYDAWTAKCKEEELKLKSNYKAKHKFGGYNECYI